MAENRRNTSKKLFIADYVERGKTLVEAIEDYQELTNGGTISTASWQKAVDEFYGQDGDRKEASESIIKDIKLKSEQEPEEKEEEEEWQCGQCGREGKGDPPPHCPGCGVEFNLE